MSNLTIVGSYAREFAQMLADCLQDIGLWVYLIFPAIWLLAAVINYLLAGFDICQPEWNANQRAIHRRWCRRWFLQGLFCWNLRNDEWQYAALEILEAEPTRNQKPETRNFKLLKK